MAEPDFEQERPSHHWNFGLTDSIGEAVVDYYNLLFDNVREFISHHEEGLKEYEQEHAELAAKLAAGGLDRPGERAIQDTLRINAERITEIIDFLKSDMANKTGIDFSAQILDDSEPELTDRFNAAPVTEKYACLVKRCMDEYRADLNVRVDLSHEDYIGASFDVDSHRRDRPSAWDDLASLGSAGRQWAERLDTLNQTLDGKRQDWEALQEYAATTSLVEIDAFRFGEEKTKDFFPKIAEQYSEHKQAEYKELLEAEPVRLYGDLIMEYAAAHVADMGERLFRLQDDSDARRSLLREHDAAKPGLVKNLTTLGQAEKAWKAGRDVLAQEISGIREQMAEVRKNREDCKEGWLSATAREEAKKMVLTQHPEVVEACEQHMARHWEETNAARLEQRKERPAGRESGNEQSQDNGERKSL